MLQSFKKILVPVDFTLNTEVAINKTLELIDDDQPVIYLLYVKKPDNAFGKDQHPDYERKLKQWKESIEDYHPSVVVRLSVKKSGSVQTAIKEKAEEEISEDMKKNLEQYSSSYLSTLQKRKTGSVISIHNIFL